MIVLPSEFLSRFAASVDTNDHLVLKRYTQPGGLYDQAHSANASDGVQTSGLWVS